MKNNEEICYCSDCGNTTPCKELTPLGNKAFCKRCYPYNILQGNAFWIALVVFTILGILFSGCDYNYAPKGKFIVDQIVQNNTEPDCNYHVKPNDLVFRDSCGKWNIGDTITISW